MSTGEADESRFERYLLDAIKVLAGLAALKLGLDGLDYAAEMFVSFLRPDYVVHLSGEPTYWFLGFVVLAAIVGAFGLKWITEVAWRWLVQLYRG